MSLGANILPVFEQLGMLEEIKSISYPVYAQHLFEANMKKSGSLSMDNYRDM